MIQRTQGLITMARSTHRTVLGEGWSQTLHHSGQTYRGVRLDYPNGNVRYRLESEHGPKVVTPSYVSDFKPDYEQASAPSVLPSRCGCWVPCPAAPVQRIPERLDLLIDLEPGELWFPSVYAPTRTPMSEARDTYQVSFPFKALLAAQPVRLAGLGEDHFRVREGKPYTDGRPSLSARSKVAPEVGVLNHGCGGMCHRAALSHLEALAEEADLRNIPRDAVLAGRRTTLGVKAMRGDTLPGRSASYVGPNQYVLALERVYLRS